MELNKHQKKVVEATDTNILCIAPPGSGKTRVLVERAAHLIEHKKVSPYELLLLTFTRKAAGEMRERLVDRIGNQAHGITIGTFHAVGLSLIQRFGELIGMRPGKITVYGEWESSYLLKEIAIELGIYKKSWNPKKKDIDKVFYKYYNDGTPPDKEDPAYPLFRAFAQRLHENNSLTYGSILTGLKLLLPLISPYLKWKHIMTDESQDSDSLQWYLVRKIQSICLATLFCVADPDQSIYGWRGADVDYLIRHQDEFKTYYLERNYRSDGNIVEAANKLISHNQNRIEKIIKPFEDAQTPIEVKGNIDSTAIVGLYNDLESESPGVKRAILGRNHFLLKKVSKMMDEADIPNTYIGKKTELTNSEGFRRFHAFLKLMVNPFDNFAFLLIRHIVGLSNKEYADIRLEAAKEGKSHFQAWNQEGTVFFKQAKEWTLAETVRILGRGIEWSPEPKEICEFVLKWASDNPNGSIEDYLNWLAVYDIQDEIQEETEGVQIMTMHAAKGLEFTTVIIAGMNEGILPSKRANSIEELEAETRLFYVAITRAKDKLIITTRPEKKECHGKIYSEPISRFVEWMKI